MLCSQPPRRGPRDGRRRAEPGAANGRLWCCRLRQRPRLLAAARRRLDADFPQPVPRQNLLRARPIRCRSTSTRGGAPPRQLVIGAFSGHRVLALRGSSAWPRARAPAISSSRWLPGGRVAPRSRLATVSTAPPMLLALPSGLRQPRSAYKPTICCATGGEEKYFSRPSNTWTGARTKASLRA